jgi:16S rRNA (guanine527-N7)-methyltransferase
VTTREFRERTRRRAKRVDVRLTDDQLTALEEYVRLLARWNRKINLTALSVAEPDDEAIDRLLMEPLVAAKYLPARPLRLIDVGSGSGSPAIPLLVTVPGLSLTMVESKTRKAVFLTEVVRALGAHATVETSRFEYLLSRPDLHEAADVVTVRAVRVETRTLLTLQAFLLPSGQLFWFRSADGSAEPDVPVPLRLSAMHPLTDAPRSALLVLAKEPTAGARL